MTANIHETLDAVREAWAHHQNWSLGRLLGSAASIQRGQLRVSPVGLTDEELTVGLKALIPEDWEIELGDKGVKK